TREQTRGRMSPPRRRAGGALPARGRSGGDEADEEGEPEQKRAARDRPIVLEPAARESRPASGDDSSHDPTPVGPPRTRDEGASSGGRHRLEQAADHGKTQQTRSLRWRPPAAGGTPPTASVTPMTGERLGRRRPTRAPARRRPPRRRGSRGYGRSGAGSLRRPCGERRRPP